MAITRKHRQRTTDPITLYATKQDLEVLRLTIKSDISGLETKLWKYIAIQTLVLITSIGGLIKLLIK